MVGAVSRKDDINKALKFYVLRDREKDKQEDEAEAERTRKKREQDEKKIKEETEYKATKDEISQFTKKFEHLKSEKTRVFEHLKKLLFESKKQRLDVEDITRLYEIGLAVPSHVSTVASHQSVHVANCVPSSIVPRTPAVSASSPYKTSTSAVLPVQTITTTKRNRSPSPVYRSTYSFKQPAGPHPFQKLEDPHRNNEYNRSYLYSKPGNAPPSSSYGAFYPPGQSIAYSHPSHTVHGNAAVYSTYNASRDNVEGIHKSQSPTAPPPSTSSQHTSLYSPHRSPASNGPPPSIQSNHIYHQKDRTPYPDEKYYMVRPGGHVPVHSVLSIQQPLQGAKLGSITSGYPVRPVATQINPQTQLHIQPPPHGGHHSSSSSHHPSLPSHHSSQSHHASSQSHQSHHQPGAVHYSPSHHVQSHSTSQASQSHSSQQTSHHQQHIQQLHLPSHHPSSNSHHQLLSHHSSPAIHHSSSQSHLQSSIHHPTSHHPPPLHHQSHIQHISSHSSSQHVPGQQLQPTSVVTSQAYANQISAIQAGGRVVYSQTPH